MRATQLCTQKSILDDDNDELKCNQYPHHILENEKEFVHQQFMKSFPVEESQNKKLPKRIIMHPRKLYKSKNKNISKKSNSLLNFYKFESKKKRISSLLPQNPSSPITCIANLRNIIYNI